jgi:hypothetical protein
MRFMITCRIPLEKVNESAKADLRSSFAASCIVRLSGSVLPSRPSPTHPSQHYILWWIKMQ